MTSDKKDSAGVTRDFSKKSLLSQCGGSGSTRYVGTTSVNGIKVSKVHFASSAESDTYYIERGPHPYVLKLTGSSKQGFSGDLVLSDFGVQPDTSEPPGAIPISAFS